MRFKFVLCYKRIKTIQIKKIPTLFHLIMQIIFWCKLILIFCLESLEEWFAFHDPSCILKTGYIFMFPHITYYKNFLIIFLKIIPDIFSRGVINSFPVLFIYNRLNFWYSLWMSPNFFSGVLQHIESIYYPHHW